MNTLEEKIQDTIRGVLEDNPWEDLNWDKVIEQSHEAVHKYLVAQITDAEDYDWLYEASELVAFNEAHRIVDSLKDTKWFYDMEHDVKQEAFDQQELARDPEAYYGVPRRSL